MKAFFDHPAFDGQLLRILSLIYYRGADYGECLATASRIEPGNYDSWFTEWFQTAEQLNGLGAVSEQHNHLTSAKEAYFRACHYYRTALFFLYGSPIGAGFIEAYDKHVAMFDKGMLLSNFLVEKVFFPFENTHLMGYFIRADDRVRPTLIINTGYDGTCQEAFFCNGFAALERGYHVFCFDGPGQGYSLIKQELYMRPDWERVVSAVIDYLTTLSLVDAEKISLLGQSWGGYLTPRAACFETRLAALIANPGQYEALRPFRAHFPAIDALLEPDQAHHLEQLMQQVMSQPGMAFKMKSKAWIHGKDQPADLVRAWKAYTLVDIASRIQCPSLILDSENETFSQGQARELYDALTCKKEYRLLTEKEGAAEHCGIGAYSLVNQIVFDWLDHLFFKSNGASKK